MFRTAAALIAALMLAFTCGAVSASTLILCRAPGQTDVVISLQDRKAFGRTLDCIKGSFAVDLTPCAPVNAYALSAPTGSAAIVGIVSRWQDYMSHSGGIVSHYVTKDEIYFAGGRVSESHGYKDEWVFTANRLNGLGLLKIEGQATVTYTCGKSSPRF